METTHSLHLELATTADALYKCSRGRPVRGYWRGKVRLSKLVARLYECPNATALQLLSELERSGLIFAVGPRGTRAGARRSPSQARWRFANERAPKNERRS